MVKKTISMVCVLALLLSIVMMSAFSADAATFAADQNALNAANYTIYGNGDEYCRYNSGTASLDVMAHTAYQNGFSVDKNTQIKVIASMDSTFGKWLGIGFLRGANFGEKATTDDGVMLYVTADESNKNYVLRIFQMNSMVEKAAFATTIPVGSKMELMLKYEEAAGNWYYYANGIKVDAGEAYFSGENFINDKGLTYMNFAYENNGKSSPIKLYSVETTGRVESKTSSVTTPATTQNPGSSVLVDNAQYVEVEDAKNPQKYILYGNGDEYCTRNEEQGSLDIMAHTAFSTGFYMDEKTSQIKLTMSMDCSYGKWLGVGFLGGATNGAPETADDGVMLYITTDADHKFYDIRIFQMNAPLKEMAHYLTNVPVGSKFDLVLKYDAEASGWYYYMNGVKIYNGQDYFANEYFTDDNGYTYLNFAYENNGKDTPIKLYSVSCTKECLEAAKKPQKDNTASDNQSVSTPDVDILTEDDGTSGGFWVWLIVIVVVVAGAGGVIFVVLKKKSKEKASAEPEDNSNTASDDTAT